MGVRKSSCHPAHKTSATYPKCSVPEQMEEGSQGKPANSGLWGKWKMFMVVVWVMFYIFGIFYKNDQVMNQVKC